MLRIHNETEFEVANLKLIKAKGKSKRLKLESHLVPQLLKQVGHFYIKANIRLYFTEIFGELR